MAAAGPRSYGAYIDESGVRGRSAKSSDYFLLGAVVFSDSNAHRVPSLLSQLRQDTGRGPGDYLSWKNVKGHSPRLHIAKTIGQQTWLRLAVVVVSKRDLGTQLPTEDHAYLYTLRLLLERLSWIGRNRNAQVNYTLAHIVRFKLASLRQYEARLRAAQTQIHWSALSPKGGSISQPQLMEELQLADLAVSAAAKAFEPDQYGNVERAYLTQMSSVLYRGPKSTGPLMSYGLKIHPSAAKAGHQWVNDL